MFMRQTVECAEAPGKVETIHSNDLAIRKQGLQYRHRGVILGILKCWTQNAGVAQTKVCITTGQRTAVLNLSPGPFQLC